MAIKLKCSAILFKILSIRAIHNTNQHDFLLDGNMYSFKKITNKHGDNILTVLQLNKHTIPSCSSWSMYLPIKHLLQIYIYTKCVYMFISLPSYVKTSDKILHNEESIPIDMPYTY